MTRLRSQAGTGTRSCCTAASSSIVGARGIGRFEVHAAPLGQPPNPRQIFRGAAVLTPRAHRVAAQLEVGGHALVGGQVRVGGLVEDVGPIDHRTADAVDVKVEAVVVPQLALPQLVQVGGFRLVVEPVDENDVGHWCIVPGFGSRLPAPGLLRTLAYDTLTRDDSAEVRDGRECRSEVAVPGQRLHVEHTDIESPEIESS